MRGVAVATADCSNAAEGRKGGEDSSGYTDGILANLGVLQCTLL